MKLKRKNKNIKIKLSSVQLRLKVRLNSIIRHILQKTRQELVSYFQIKMKTNDTYSIWKDLMISCSLKRFHGKMLQ